MSYAPEAPSANYIDAVPFLSEALGKSPALIRRWIRQGRVPPPDLAVSRQCKLWRTSTLVEWLEAGR